MQDGPRVPVWSNKMLSADGTGGRGGCVVSKLNWSSWPESRHSIRMSIVKVLACSDRVESAIRRLDLATDAVGVGGRIKNFGI